MLTTQCSVSNRKFRFMLPLKPELKHAFFLFLFQRLAIMQGKNVKNLVSNFGASAKRQCLAAIQSVTEKLKKAGIAFSLFRSTWPRAAAGVRTPDGIVFAALRSASYIYTASIKMLLSAFRGTVTQLRSERSWEGKLLWSLASKFCQWPESYLQGQAQSTF